MLIQASTGSLPSICQFNLQDRPQIKNVHLSIQLYYLWLLLCLLSKIESNYKTQGSHQCMILCFSLKSVGTVGMSHHTGLFIYNFYYCMYVHTWHVLSGQGMHATVHMRKSEGGCWDWSWTLRLEKQVFSPHGPSQRSWWFIFYLHFFPLPWVYRQRAGIILCFLGLSLHCLNI